MHFFLSFFIVFLFFLPFFLSSLLSPSIPFSSFHFIFEKNKIFHGPLVHDEGPKMPDTVAIKFPPNAIAGSDLFHAKTDGRW